MAAALAALQCTPAWPADAARLQILVLEGEGAVHNIRRKATSPVAVEVRDWSNRPVEGARVRFTLPELGPGGRFVDGSRTLEVRTDARGRAGYSAFVLNGQEGRFSVSVEAVSEGREAGTSITQSSSLFHYRASSLEEPDARRTSRSRAVALVLGIGAAATAVGVLASRGGGGPQTPPVAVGVGPVAVGGPR